MRVSRRIYSTQSPGGRSRGHAPQSALLGGSLHASLSHFPTPLLTLSEVIAHVSYLPSHPGPPASAGTQCRQMVQRAPNTSDVSSLCLTPTAASGDNVGVMQTLNKSHPTYRQVKLAVPTQAPASGNVQPQLSERSTSVIRLKTITSFTQQQRRAALSTFQF